MSSPFRREPYIELVLAGLLLERGAGICIFALGVSEKFDGQNICIAVDNAAEQQRSRLGGFSRARPDAWHKEIERAAICSKPKQQRYNEHRIHCPEQYERAQPLYGYKNRSVA
jgi:hypothetical protein